MARRWGATYMVMSDEDEAAESAIVDGDVEEE